MKEGWEYKRFDEIMSPAKVERCGNRIDLPVLSITMRGGIVEQNDRFKKTIASLDRTNYKIVKDGQLVIAFPIDEGLLYTQDVAPEGIMSPAYNIWDVDYSQIDRRFLVAYFHSTFAFAYYKAKLRGSTQRRRSMDKADLLSMPIPVPSIDNQQQIVSELDLLSGVIEKQKAQLEELDKLAQSIFYDMFGDPVSNDKDWAVIQLGDKCEVTSFKRVLIEEVVEEGIPFIRGTELTALSKMTNSENYEFSLFITPDHYERVKAISGVPSVGDLLIPSINADGNIWILDTSKPRYFKDGRVLWVHVNHDVYTSSALKYIMQVLLKDTYSDMASGATFAELKLFVLRELKIILPPLYLQQEFAAKVEAIEAMKAKVRQSLKEVETLFNERMDYYFN